jgi:hypothetical protein
MKNRLLALIGVLTVPTAIVVGLQVGSVSVDGQTQNTTAWGHPNLEGIWLDVYATPLERDPELGDREFATDEERAERDQARMGSVGRDRRVTRGSQQDVAGAYNAVYTSVKPAGPRTSLVVDPADGRIPTLTEEAKRDDEIQREWRLMLLRNTETCQYDAPACEGGTYGSPSPNRYDITPFYNTSRMNRHDGPEDQSTYDRCIAGSTPDFVGFRRIVQGEDSIAFAYDTGQGQGFQRVVYLGGNHPPSQIRLRHGDSRAHWEGETLVIETTNFSPKFTFRPGRPFSGAESGANRVLTERYRRVDENTLNYEVTIADPTIWTAPWTVRQELKRQNDQQNRIYYEPRCHEGNYGLPALLIGARLEEQEFAEGRGPDPFSLDTATDFGGGVQ